MTPSGLAEIRLKSGRRTKPFSSCIRENPKKTETKSLSSVRFCLEKGQNTRLLICSTLHNSTDRNSTVAEKHPFHQPNSLAPRELGSGSGLYDMRS